jgi:hypothetical protein
MVLGGPLRSTAGAAAVAAAPVGLAEYGTTHRFLAGSRRAGWQAEWTSLSFWIETCV